MKERTISLSEARQTLASLAQQFPDECPAIVITRNNRPLLTIMPYEAYQSLLETIDSLQTLLKIMSGGNELVEQALQNKKEKVSSAPALTHHVSWEEFKEEVGWE